MNDKAARIRQYRAARDGVLRQWELRTEMMDEYSDQTLFKLAKAHGLDAMETSRGEVIFEILEREHPMPELRRFQLTPDDVAVEVQ